MINAVGNTVATIHLHDYVISMVNVAIPPEMGNNIQIYSEYDSDDETQLRYVMSIAYPNSRCLMFSRSLSGDSLSNTLRPVLYIPNIVTDVGTGGVTCIPLYECIAPTIEKFVSGNYQLTWWSNTDNTPTKDRNGKYVYNYSEIHHFNKNSLGDVESSSSSCKILCTAPIHWEKLCMIGYDAPNVVSLHSFYTPIIRNIAILTCIQGEGYIVDFATGGGGGGGEGGAKMHNHLNNQECGFAGAVFMPSAMPRIISWK